MIRSSHRQVPAWRRRALVIAGTVAVMAGVAMPASAATGWVLQTTPNPASGVDNELNSVSCPSASNCVAVGNQETSAGASTALAEQWNGSTWALQTAVNPAGDTGLSLNGVSCPTATYCVAVGDNDVSEASSTAVAESWNGSTWTLMSPASPTVKAWLNAVSCTSASNCEAVGYEATGLLAEHWDGSTWTVQTVGTETGIMTGVSCVSAKFCMAVTGTDYAYWNGSSWNVEELNLPASTADTIAVSCTSASNCEAVGETDPFGTIYPITQQWNGSTWTTKASGGPADAGLYAVSCASATGCSAVGSEINSSGDGVTLAERWNGTSWAVQTSPNPSGAQSAGLAGISCPTTADCTAVGSWYVSNQNKARTLGEQWTS